MSSQSTSLRATSLADASAANPAASIRIDSESLQTTQWRAALVSIGVPTLVTVYALVMALQRGVHPAALWAFGAMHFASMLGITVGFHRFGAHRSFECAGITRAALVALGSMAAQGPLVHWVSNHRRHHQFSDKAGDVHSPWQPESGGAKGFWHSHLGWMFEPDVTNPVRYSRDLLQDPALMRLNRAYLWFVLFGLAAPALVVFALTRSSVAALDALVWAGFVRIFVAHHVTWAINSVAHLWGSRMFRSPDRSVNVAWLALPSAGESWHNGHHAFPGSARFGFAWYQIDLGYSLICLLEALGLASDVNRPSAGAIGRLRVSSGQQEMAHKGDER